MVHRPTDRQRFWKGFDAATARAPEARLVLLVIQQIAYGNRDSELGQVLARESVDWECFQELLGYHELTAFTYLVLQNFCAQIPPQVLDTLKQSYYIVLSHNLKMGNEFRRIYDVCSNHGISALPIKGIALIPDLYTHAPLRQMCDIDLLCKLDELPRLKKAFLELGYFENLQGLREEYWLTTKNQLPFTLHSGNKGATMRCNGYQGLVEVHFDIDYTRKEGSILSSLWGRIRQVSVEGRVIPMLSGEDTLFNLALHQRIFGKGTCLKYVLDTALLLKKYGSEFDWDYIIRQARKAQMRTTVFFLITTLRLINDRAVPEEVLRALSVSYLRQRCVVKCITKNTFRGGMHLRLKMLYLQLHFLLYDSIWESARYLLTISPEHFALFYNLTPYVKKTKVWYHLRLAYMPFSILVRIVREAGKLQRQTRYYPPSQAYFRKKKTEIKYIVS